MGFAEVFRAQFETGTMFKIITFAFGVLLITATAMLITANTKSGQANAGSTGDDCRTVQIQPDAAYGDTKVTQLRVCR
mgnify:CR=1 FL=1|jgi:hypothetical protein